MSKIWKYVAATTIAAATAAAFISCAQVRVAAVPDRVAAVPETKVLLENECVRVQYHDVAVGQTIPMHSHPTYIVYVLKSFKARITLADGTQRMSERQAGDVYWNEPITHSVENLGSSDIHNLIIELKSATACR